MDEYKVREIILEEKKPDGCSVIAILLAFGLFIYGASQFAKEMKQLKDDVQMLKEKADVQK